MPRCPSREPNARMIFDACDAEDSALTEWPGEGGAPERPTGDQDGIRTEGFEIYAQPVTPAEHLTNATMNAKMLERHTAPRVTPGT